MKKVLKPAFIATIPVLTGYLVLGFGFGIILKANGYSILLALAMSVFIYAGSMQYVAIGLLSGGASLNHCHSYDAYGQCKTSVLRNFNAR